jgi:hypothetical protein
MKEYEVKIVNILEEYLIDANILRLWSRNRHDKRNSK